MEYQLSINDIRRPSAIRSLSTTIRLRMAERSEVSGCLKRRFLLIITEPASMPNPNYHKFLSGYKKLNNEYRILNNECRNKRQNEEGGVISTFEIPCYIFVIQGCKRLFSEGYTLNLTAIGFRGVFSRT